MSGYTDEPARPVMNQNMDDVFAYYRRRANNNRPVAKRAIANLTGGEAEPVPEASAGPEVAEDADGFRDMDEQPLSKVDTEVESAEP